MRTKDQGTLDAILKFVNKYYQKNRVAPTITDVAEGVGVARSTTHRYLQELSERGVLNYDRGILTDEKFSVSVEYAGQTVDVVDIKANDGKSISNELIYGEVHGMKKDENGSALSGATIGLFYTDGKEPVLTTVSAEDGSFFFKDIPFGEYERYASRQRNK